jgi:FtsH-binding integral membrane protein
MLLRERKEDPMPRAAQVATIGFAGMIVFEAALAVGARLGDAAWGGAHAQLTTGQRLGSAVSVLFYAAAIIIVRRRAAGRAERRYCWGTWGLVVIFALSALVNLASQSQWENYLMAPVALVLAALCVIVARAPSGHRGRMPEGPPATAARA